MRRMMLDAMEARANVVRCDLKRRGKIFANAGEALHHARAVEGKPRHANRVTELRSEAGPRIARDRDVVDLSQIHTRLLEAELNRSSRKPRGVLDAVEALFLDG